MLKIKSLTEVAAKVSAQPPTAEDRLALIVPTSVSECLRIESDWPKIGNNEPELQECCLPSNARSRSHRPFSSIVKHNDIEPDICRGNCRERYLGIS